MWLDAVHQGSTVLGHFLSRNTAVAVQERSVANWKSI